uniref:Uncharacterized protein n=1 Tax=Zea mays TaxID=4577 RepID=B4FEG6_MAIZE|nr:unknown [Zea mays]
MGQLQVLALTNMGYPDRAALLDKMIVAESQICGLYIKQPYTSLFMQHH